MRSTIRSLPKALSCFNPRPAVRPGDALRLGQQCKATLRFNPRPAVRPGDARIRYQYPHFFKVSIRARP